MTLNYQSPPPSTSTTHDHIYTTLLAILAFFIVLGIVSILYIASLATSNYQDLAARHSLRLSTLIHAAFLLPILPVLPIRLFAPRLRRYPTLFLNIILLIHIPFGTALAIYGLLRADKLLRPPPTP